MPLDGHARHEEGGPLRRTVLVVEMAGLAQHRVEVERFAAGDDHGAAVELAAGSQPPDFWREQMRTAGWRSTPSGSISG
jgi:hypothetical protein